MRPITRVLVACEYSGKVWRMPPSADRWKLRSETYQGIADAMSQQWGSDLAKQDPEATDELF